MLDDFGAENLPPLLNGALLTVFLVATSGFLGTVIGLALGLARTSPSRVARVLSLVYISFIRGQPVLIILFFVYFVLPLLFPMASVSRAVAAIAGLSVYAGAYIAEIVRGSLLAVPTGQSEAAEALGMGYALKLRYVVLPQALRIAVPPGIGFLVALVKATSLTSVIGYVELTRAGRITSTINQEPILTFLIVAALYFVICYPISMVGRWYERRLA
ncbi:amino acid ABC transporter permease [Aeromicrobium sp. CTD01-1L150]|uniref:amino acid ABC transporter permease n=1 Tax=Aeromicrobium sp. CTD01-1L150 TaxID=3341830 RepID=UPI0035C114A2